jgi:hypothetical protein
MPQKPKRDGAYYLGRLEREHPAAFADYQAGKFASINEAIFSVGMKKPRTRLDELKNAWEKATNAERKAFITWLWPTSTTPATAPSPAPGPIAIDRRLEPWAKARIRHIMSVRGLKAGDVMDETGFKRLNASLGMALSGNTRVQPSMISALERWLVANASV